MIDEKLIPMGGLRKEPFSGCHGGMRYYFQADGTDTFTVTVYPEPWAFDKTPEENKEHTSYPMTAEGMASAVEWLNGQYENRKDYWLNSLKNSMQIVYALKGIP